MQNKTSATDVSSLYFRGPKYEIGERVFDQIKAFRESCLINDIRIAESALDLGKILGVKATLVMEYGERES